MQSAGNVELAAHLAGELGEVRPVLRLEVDWGDGVWTDLSAVVREMTLERALTGDLPEDAGLIDGFTSGALDATLEGSWIDGAGLEWPIRAALSPYVPGNLRDGRQLVQARARVSLGAVLDSGPVLLRQWTGVVRELDGATGDGTVKLAGVDPSDRLRAPITLPTYAEFVTHAARRKWALTVNTAALVNHILRANGIYPSPPARDEAIISATGHGCLFAERGFNGAPISIYGTGPMGGLWTEDSHPYGQLGTPENSTGGTVGYQEFYGMTDGVATPVMFQAGYGVGISCLLHMGSYMTLGASLENRIFQVRVTENEYPRLFVSGFGDGQIYAGITTAAGAVYATPKIPTGSGRWRFFGVHFQFTSNTQLVVRVRMDGQLRTYTLTIPAVVITPTDRFGGYRPITQLNANLFRAWTNLQLWPSYAPPAAGAWQGETHTSQADVARGLNELLYLPDIAGADSWDLLKAVVAAELGVHAFDENGRYSFRPRTDVRRSVVDIELDVATNLADAKWSTSTDSTRNVVTLETKSAYHAGIMEPVVKADDVLQFVCEVGTTTFELDWPYGAAGYQGGILPYHYQEGADTAARDAAGGFPKWGNDVVHGWTYSSKGASGNWTILDNSRSVVARYVQTGARTAQLRVSNPGPGPVRLATAQPADASSDGEPAMRIGGWPLQSGTNHVEALRAPAAQVKAQLGDRVLPLSSTDWRQSPAALRPLGYALLDALRAEVTVLEDLEVAYDPRVQTGDVARLRFPDGAIPITGTVVKARPVMRQGAPALDVSVRPLPTVTVAPAGWTFYLDISRYQGDRADPIQLPTVKALGYGGLVARIGQGAGSYTATDGTVSTNGALIDPWWETFRDQGRTLWPSTFAGYWYVGNTETPAAQAQRCAAAIGDTSIPVMLDWERKSGTWANLLAVRDAFRAAGLRPTMFYCSSSYPAETAGGQPTSMAGSGMNYVRARYWIDDPAAHMTPRAQFDDITDPRSFGLSAVRGAVPSAFQFTQYGLVYTDSLGQRMEVDVNAYPGDEAALGRMFRGEGT